jgi:hypothetical protein
MSANPALVQQLSSYQAMGMTPAAAAAVLSATSTGVSFAHEVSFVQESGDSALTRPSTPPATIQPNDLSQALTTAYVASLTTADLASIIHTNYPDLSSQGVAQAVLAGLPSTSETDMYNALTGCGFSTTDAQGAVNILYPATITIQSTQPWQATGVNVTGQQITTLTYVTGSWTANPATGMCGPNGNAGYVAKSSYTLPGAKEGAMIGQIGSNSPFLVGTSCTAPAGQSGMLSLCINDDLSDKYGSGLADNQGALTFTITTSASS